MLKLALYSLASASACYVDVYDESHREESNSLCYFQLIKIGIYYQNAWECRSGNYLKLQGSRFKNEIHAESNLLCIFRCREGKFALRRLDNSYFYCLSVTSAAASDMEWLNQSLTWFFVLSAISSRLVMLKNVDVLCEIYGCYFYEHLFLLVVFHITRIRIRMQFGYLSKHSKIITSRSSSVASDCLVSNMNGSLQKSRDNVQRWRFNLHLPDPWPKQSPLTDALICCSLSQCERQTTEHCSKSSILIRAIIRRLIPKNRPYWHRCMVHFFGGWFEKLRPHPFLTPGLAFSTSWRTCRCAFYRLKPHRTIFYHFSKKWLCHRLQHVNALGHPRRDVTRGICQIYLLDFEAPWVYAWVTARSAAIL